MIKLIVLDVDGTLTDGKVTYSTSGEEMKSFDISDGLAIAVWTKKLGKKAAIITGRNSSIVERRANELGIQHLHQGIHNKQEVLEKILEEEGISWNEVASIGDDLNDYHMLKKSGLSFTPANGTSYLKEFVNVVCQKKGGDGAVREMLEYIFKEDGLEEDFLNAWI